jgi:hypothetical protein
MNTQDVTRLIALSKELWPTWKPSEVTPEAWLLMIGDYPYEQAKAAVIEHRKETNDFAPNVGAVTRLCQPSLDDAAKVLAICDQWYKMSDDISVHPNREDREKHPVAAMTWDLAGGYGALGDREWAHQRLRKCYSDAAKITNERNVIQRVSAVTSIEANTFMKALQGSMNE